MARLPQVTRDELDAEGQATYDRLLAGFNARPGYTQQTRVGGLYGLLMHSPELAARISAVGDYILQEGGIEFLDKEIVCLTVARETNCQLEWTVHEPMSRDAGVPEETIQGIKRSDYDVLLPRERLMADFSREVLRDNVTDATWKGVEALMGRKGAVNLTALVTFTALICHCMDAFQLELPTGAEPLLPIG